MTKEEIICSCETNQTKISNLKKEVNYLIEVLEELIVDSPLILLNNIKNPIYQQIQKIKLLTKKEELIKILDGMIENIGEIRWKERIIDYKNNLKELEKGL